MCADSTCGKSFPSEVFTLNVKFFILGIVLFYGGPLCSQDMLGRVVHVLLLVGPKLFSMTMVTKKKGKGKGFTLILGFGDFRPMR